jgi:hypothetical protein
MAAVFTFVSIGYLHNGQEEVISLEQMQKHCRDVRVQDLLADLAILCEDVVERRVPTERLSIPDRQRMGADVTQESLEAEFPGWETWLGVDNRWCARVKGAEPPVLVQGRRPRRATGRDHPQAVADAGVLGSPGPEQRPLELARVRKGEFRVRPSRS